MRHLLWSATRLLPGTLAVALLLGAVGCATRESPGASVTLRLMSHNIRIGKGGGEWNDDPAKVDLEPVLRVIRAQQPDLVGLQEVDRFRRRTAGMDQPGILAERLGMNAAFQPGYTITASPRDEEYGNALLSRFPVKSSARFPLFKPDYRASHPHYPDYFSEQRSLLHAVIDVHGRDVHVFVTHLGLTAAQRRKQVAEILEILARFDGPKILVGDFNADPGEPAMMELSSALQDVLSAVNTTPSERNSYPAGANPKKAIDYVFVSREFRVLNAAVLRDESLASDHNPVIAEVSLPLR